MGRRTGGIKTSILDIYRYWKDHLDELKLLDTDYEDVARCFGCGRLPRGTSIFGPANKLKWRNTTRLQRSHIVAHSFGGVDEPSNCLLLCDQCHYDMPDINDREMMLRWIRGRKEDMVYWQARMADAFECYGYAEWERNKELGEILMELAQAEASTAPGNLGQELTTHGKRVSEATYVALAVREYEKRHGRPKAT